MSFLQVPPPQLVLIHAAQLVPCLVQRNGHVEAKMASHYFLRTLCQVKSLLCQEVRLEGVLWEDIGDISEQAVRRPLQAKLWGLFQRHETVVRVLWHVAPKHLKLQNENISNIFLASAREKLTGWAPMGITPLLGIPDNESLDKNC